MENIYVNADDYGMNSSVNKAIVESFKLGIINSTTIMANMPGFDEAVDLAYKNNLTDNIGVHLNLSEGNPLTKAIQNTKLFRNNESLGLERFKKKLFLLSRFEEKIIFKEFATQIERVKSTGIPVTHIDTHHHVDEVWSITKILLPLLKEYNIPSMRIMNNLNASTSFYKRFYRKTINSYIKSRKANFSDFFGNQIEAISHYKINRAVFNKSVEIMVHPDYNPEGNLIDKVQNKKIPFDLLKSLVP